MTRKYGIYRTPVLRLSFSYPAQPTEPADRAAPLQMAPARTVIETMTGTQFCKTIREEKAVGQRPPVLWAQSGTAQSSRPTLGRPLAPATIHSIFRGLYPRSTAFRATSCGRNIDSNGHTIALCLSVIAQCVPFATRGYLNSVPLALLVEPSGISSRSPSVYRLCLPGALTVFHAIS